MATAGLPPLAKFAAAPFGVVERFAEGAGYCAVAGDAAQCGSGLRRARPADGRCATAPAGKGEHALPSTDADIIAWFRKGGALRRFFTTAARRGAR